LVDLINMQIILIDLIKVQISIKISPSTKKFMFPLSEPNLGFVNVNKITLLWHYIKTNMAAERTCVNIGARQVIELFKVLLKQPPF
jgi:hypothetical protein